MEVLESHLVSSIEDLYGDEDMISSKIWLLHTPHTSAHEKGQDMATGFKCSIGQPTVWPKHY